MSDISLSNQVDPKGVNVAMTKGSLEVIPIDTSDNESMVVNTIYDTKT